MDATDQAKFNQLIQKVDALNTKVKHLLTNRPASSGIPGVVRNKGGQNWYSVDIYENGFVYENGNPVDKTDTVQAWQMQINSTETIQYGTCVIVVKAGETYVMQVPVWLE